MPEENLPHIDQERLVALLEWLPFNPAYWESPLYLVGGAVRDTLLGRARRTLDLDFVTPGPVVFRARQLALDLGAGFVLLDAEHQIARVVCADPAMTLDFAHQQGDDPTSDLERRDFTVNALAWDLHQRTLLDPLGGLRDLQARQLRMISPTNLNEDPLRLMRAYRLAAQLNFEIETATRQAMQDRVGLLKDVSAERMRDELAYLLECPRGAHWLMCAYRDGALADWLPEIALMEAVENGDTSHLTLVERTFEVVHLVDRVVEDLDAHQDFERSIAGGRSVRVTVKLAALLHDIAQPLTRQFHLEGKSGSISPEKLATQMSQVIMQRLKFSREEERWVTSLVFHHRRPAQLSSQPADSRAVYRLFRDLGEMLPALLVLALAERRAILDRLPCDLEFEQLTHHLLECYRTPGPMTNPPLVDGHTLMAKLGLSRGPRVGQLLGLIREAQAVEEVTTQQEALMLARVLLDELEA
ncbi:MAG: CCA tRNA nucleotidyltransferase [Gemmatimonadaceae bacterium]|nr:CCA tRNA nucleotidyltransferase [Gloeobacterales cyanobacterium ES-bin-141]